MANRPPAVAGIFYPDEPATLNTEVLRLLNCSMPESNPESVPKALIVPHAGYIYSGSVAASAFATLGNALACSASAPTRVVLLGPAHRVAVQGCALPSVEAFATPLGGIPIDVQSCKLLESLNTVSLNDQAHALEHCLEVQLPFLQCVLQSFEIVPLLVGQIKPADLGRVLTTLWGGPETIFIISSDLSHYLPYTVAKRIDRLTIDEILTLQPHIDTEQACGARVINGFLMTAQKLRLRPQLIDFCNSGDTAGDRDRVVGYASLAFYEETHDAGPNLH